PTASYIYNELSRWYNIVNRSVAKDKNELTILNVFQSADEIIPTLSAKLSNYSKDKLTSKLLSFKDLSKPINSLPAELLKIHGEHYALKNVTFQFLMTSSQKFSNRLTLIQLGLLDIVNYVQ
ncbi:2469_t:CDS:2, partial [Dentiscutata heterogama]